MALLTSPRGRPVAAAVPKAAAQTPEAWLELARHQFAVGHVRQAMDAIGRCIDGDRNSTNACLTALWDQPAVTTLPNMLCRVLARFEAASGEYKVYQWLLLLSYLAKGSRQLGLQTLGRAINSVNDGTSPMLGGIKVPSAEHWLRAHGMADVTQAEFWKGVDTTATVSQAITQARCRFLNALNLADEQLPQTLPLLRGICGVQPQVLALLAPAQKLRLLELHARRERGLVLCEDEVRAMVAGLSEEDRRVHMSRALLHGHPFHVKALLAAGATLADVPQEAVNNRTCQDRYLVEKMLEAGVSAGRLADLMVGAPDANAGRLPALPLASLEALLLRGLSPNHRIGGDDNGTTLLWEAVRRKDAAAVKLLRDAPYAADCNAVMRVKQEDATEAFTTPGLFALAHGDGPTLRAMRMQDGTALLPGINMILEGVRRIS